MQILGVQVSIGVSSLHFTFLPDSHKVQNRISIGHAQQGSDLLIGCFPLPHAVTNMYPAGTKAMLLHSKQNVG